ncbi:MAG: M20/M25/M40 family metallo-hydrolase [Methanomicrobium sp.]|nr:M20/M25/M40 family metallo-hydrolase [Methanomicrobium sp.]
MDAAKICSELVKIRSENPPGNTTDVIEYIAEILASLGIRYNIVDEGEGHCNLYTHYSHPLLFMGHVDVVPAMDSDWDRPPFSGEIAEGFVHGRGSTDMKGGCAAALCAVAEYVESNSADIDSPCNLCFVCDEEGGGHRGSRRILAKKLIKPCDCLIAEPTPALNPTIGQKGLIRASIEFVGNPGHGSLYPCAGKSAIMKAGEFLSRLKALHSLEFSTDPKIETIYKRSSEIFRELLNVDSAEEILKHITFNPGMVSGGEGVNIVAQRCSLSWEMRIPIGCNTDELIARLRAENPDDVIDIKDVCSPNLTSSDSKIVGAVCGEIERVYHKESFPIIQWAASDARHLRAAGFNAIEYGPGELNTLHAVNEKVSVENLSKAVDVYKGVLGHYN